MAARSGDHDRGRGSRCTCNGWRNTGSSPVALMIGVLFIIAALLEWARGHLGPVAVFGVIALVAGVTFMRWLAPRLLRQAKASAAADAVQPLRGDDGELTYGTASSTMVRQMDLPGLRIVLAAASGQADTAMMLRHQSGDDRCAFVLSPHSADATAVHGMLRAAHEGEPELQATAVEILRLWQEAYAGAEVLVGCWEASTRKLAYFSVGFETPSIINHGWPHRTQTPIDADGAIRQAMTFGVHQLSGAERWLLFTRPLVDVGDPHRQPFNEVGLVQYAHDAVAMEPTAWVRYLLQQALEAHHGDLPAGAMLVSLMSFSSAAPEKRPLRRIAIPVHDDDG
ncbi:MAG: hypothetical protein ABFD92_12625 [Planctomycetaceae bacterium]|nr:serine/threonine-protein phosphatase [Planctomycetaceae bacterium]